MKQEPRPLENSAYVPLDAGPRYLGCSPKQLMRLIQAGHIPAFRFPPRGQYRVRLVDLDAFMERCKVQAEDLDAVADEIVREVLK